MQTIAQHVQGFALDPDIELFEFDLDLYGAGIRRYVNDVTSGGVSFGGVAYEPLPIVSDGWSVSAKGTLPRPTLSVSNVTGLFSFLNDIYSDLVGVGVQRVRTYKWALDGQPDADPFAIVYPIDLYSIAQKTHQDDEFCSYELRSAMDLAGVMFPGRMMVQNFCGHVYRRWNGSAFDYTKASCPYSGTVHRTRNGTATDAAHDKCGKTLPECVERFGINQDLPFRGFPGIDRVRL